MRSIFEMITKRCTKCTSESHLQLKKIYQKVKTNKKF